MMKYIPAIGLEVHIELATKSKMFCPCPNDPEETRPNVNVCPICLGHPGTLPTINKEAVRAVVKLGLALGGRIPEHSHFDRKSYFYPDLPKGYQISQYEEPFVKGGELCGIRVRRIHLEEDTGRLLHELPVTSEEKADPVGTAFSNEASYVDFNRAGVPLMELVTEPDITDGKIAVALAKELQLILRYIGVSNADMEKGQMRIEANISIRRAESSEFGTKVEVKNLNSFRAVEEAIDYELGRQERVVRGGGSVVQETRGWNDAKRVTEVQRSKESAHDYRYFPEPDLPPIDTTKVFNLEKERNALPELPEAKRRRFASEFGLEPGAAKFLAEERPLADFFENAATEMRTFPDPPPYLLLYNYLVSDFRGILRERGEDIGSAKVTPEHFAHLIALIGEGKLLSRLAKNILAEMAKTGEDPETLIRKGGVEIMRDERALAEAVAEVIAANAKAVEDYRRGKKSALQFLIGQVMARTKGQAQPEALRTVLQKFLDQA